MVSCKPIGFTLQILQSQLHCNCTSQPLDGFQLYRLCRSAISAIWPPRLNIARVAAAFFCGLCLWSSLFFNHGRKPGVGIGFARKRPYPPLLLLLAPCPPSLVPCLGHTSSTVFQWQPRLLLGQVYFAKIQFLILSECHCWAAGGLLPSPPSPPPPAPSPWRDSPPSLDSPRL